MKLLFLGDFHYHYSSLNPDIIEMGEYFKSQQFSVVINCEGSIKASSPINKTVILEHNENLVGNVLKKLNTRAVCLANNHVMDWQEQGFYKLLQILGDCHIDYFGAGSNLSKAIEPFIIEDENHKKIGLLGFGWDVEKCVKATVNSAGVAPLDEKLILQTIKKVRKEVDFLIIMFHWGYGYDLYPLPIHRKLAHNVVDAGADLIIGHHPHVIQAFELYHDKPIYYSIGNFYLGCLRGVKKQFFNTDVVDPDLGLGIIFNTASIEIRHLLIQSEIERTKVEEGGFSLPDLSDIDLKTYSKSFNRLRTTFTKPSLFATNLSWLVNPIILFLYEVGNEVLMLIVKAMHYLNIYQTAKKIPQLRRLSYFIRGTSKVVK